MSHVVADARRRLFFRLCASVAAGVAVPAIHPTRVGLDQVEYAVINGWVVPLRHLKASFDA